MTSGGIGGSGISAPVPCLSDDCNVTHSSSGWCSVATGNPVIIVVTVSCEDGSPSVQTIDASSGAVIPNGPVMPCGTKDWEVNQLCDVDPLTGQVLSTVTQIFEWDENTSSLVISLEQPDNPGVPYVPVGILQTCSGGQIEALTQIVCGNDGGVLRQLTEVILIDTLDGTVRTVYYLDAEATVVVPGAGETFTVGSCYEPSLVSIDGLLGAVSVLCEDDPDLPALRTVVCGPISTSAVEVAADFEHDHNADIDSGAAEQIVVAPNPAVFGVLIKALVENTGTIYIGKSAAVTSSNGFPLGPGDAMVLPVDDANKVWAIASIDDQALAWVAI